MHSHSARSETESKNAVEVNLKVSQRDPSVRAGLAFFARDDGVAVVK